MAPDERRPGDGGGGGNGGAGAYERWVQEKYTRLMRVAARLKARSLLDRIEEAEDIVHAFLLEKGQRLHQHAYTDRQIVRALRNFAIHRYRARRSHVEERFVALPTDPKVEPACQDAAPGAISGGEHSVLSIPHADGLELMASIGTERFGHTDHGAVLLLNERLYVALRVWRLRARDLTAEQPAPMAEEIYPWDEAILSRRIQTRAPTLGETWTAVKKHLALPQSPPPDLPTLLAPLGIPETKWAQMVSRARKHLALRYGAPKLQTLFPHWPRAQQA